MHTLKAYHVHECLAPISPTANRADLLLQLLQEPSISLLQHGEHSADVNKPQERPMPSWPGLDPPSWGNAGDLTTLTGISMCMLLFDARVAPYMIGQTKPKSPQNFTAGLFSQSNPLLSSLGMHCFSHFLSSCTWESPNHEHQKRQRDIWDGLLSSTWLHQLHRRQAAHLLLAPLFFKSFSLFYLGPARMHLSAEDFQEKDVRLIKNAYNLTKYSMPLSSVQIASNNLQTSTNHRSSAPAEPSTLGPFSCEETQEQGTRTTFKKANLQALFKKILISSLGMSRMSPLGLLLLLFLQGLANGISSSLKGNFAKERC